ncbi:MAG: DUF4430 domain-containing protein [Candidatus Staskawiczbacteria bacterium]|nr:DUF4430 domain-containing protein [Candidatus Staskawiczbacteria bacterium]
MKKNIYVIVGLGIIIIGSWLIISNSFWRANVKETDVFLETAEKEGTAEKEVVLVIDNGEKESLTSNANFIKGMTAFDLLKEEVEKLALELKTKNYDMGIFIEAIGNRENGQDGKYWLYYVNGQFPTVAADRKEIKAGDKVEFKFEKSPF